MEEFIISILHNGHTSYISEISMNNVKQTRTLNIETTDDINKALILKNERFSELLVDSIRRLRPDDTLKLERRQ